MSEQDEAEAPVRPLFRAAALRHGADRLHGTVRLATPLGWQIIGFLLLGSIVIVSLFLGMASYARVETATGAITLDRGVAAISASRPGVVDALFVKTGDVVAGGQPLARIQSEEQLIGGATASERTEDALRRQDARLLAQGGLLLEAARAERTRYREQLAGLLAEILSLEGQIADQRRLVAVSETEATRTAEVAEKGFISRRDLEDRRAVLIERRQRLAALEQLRSSKISSAAEARSAIVQAAATAQAQVASTESARAEISQRLATTASAPGYVLTAPVPGRVTAVTARPGQRASAEQPVMVVVPAHSRLQVELYVPTAAAGFLALGQELRLAVDAFPYQRFGTVIARVQDISTVTVVKSGANGPVPVYLVTGELQRSSVEAFGRLQPLVPGMTLTARIVTERRSLLEWLFEPVFAIRRR